MKNKKWRYTVWDDGDSSVFEDKGGSLLIDATIAKDIKTEADAKLIASAPELLEACKSVDKWLMDGWNEEDLNTAVHPLFKKALLKVREAIKKATNETT
jgi:hypothetical protein